MIQIACEGFIFVKVTSTFISGGFTPPVSCLNTSLAYQSLYLSSRKHFAHLFTMTDISGG